MNTILLFADASWTYMSVYSVHIYTSCTDPFLLADFLSSIPKLKMSSSLPLLAISLPLLAISLPLLAISLPLLARSLPRLVTSLPRLATSLPTMAISLLSMAISLPPIATSLPLQAISLPVSSLREVVLPSSPTYQCCPSKLVSATLAFLKIFSN